MKVYAFVPAKGTSERIENKNKRVLDGDMLYVKALKTLLNCKEIDRVFLDTESTEMYEAVNYLPITFMKRDENLANNKTDGHKMFLNEVNSYPDADIYVQLLCTSPFIKSETIDNAIKVLKNSDEYDSAVLMKKEKFYFWDEKQKPTYDINHIPNSKDLPDTLIESMGLYISKKETAMNTKRRFGNTPYLIFGSLEELIDVNNPEDLEFAQNYAKGLKQKEIAKFRLLKHFITSALLSDLLDDFEAKYGEKCGGIVNGFKSNLNNKLIGRASTIRLRKLKQEEDITGIYKALNHYNFIGENDIICVENELSQYAYFGDLNARLAIRAGAQGAVINGMTRDKKATELLDFPIFAKGYNSQDVRRKATLDYINKPIQFNGVVVHPHDLIFIDDCSFAVIYSKYENEILEEIFNKFLNEKNIIEDILLYKNTNEIINQRGNF